MKRSFGKYIAGLLPFGSNGVVASFIGLGSSEIVLLRTALGGALLWALFFLSGHSLTALRYRRDLGFVALSGLAVAADWLLLFEAYARIGVGLGMLINYCGPVIVMALSPLVFRERLRGPKLAALAAALAGVCLIGGQSASAGVDAVGLICAGLSAVAYAAMVICNKLSRRVVGMENAALQLLFALVPVAIFVGGRQGLAMDIAPGDWPPILLLGLINTGLGCFLYFSSIGELPAQTVAICGYLEPLSAVLFSALILGERMLPLQMLGAALIICGALAGNSAVGQNREILREPPLNLPGSVRGSPPKSDPCRR